MRTLAACFFLMIVMLSPVWGAEPEQFDPEQPFQEAMSQRLVESLVGEVLAALGDHLEISGSFDPNQPGGDRKQGLRFKLYPRGKSRADEPLVAEGWFGPSQNSGQQEFHLRFALPKQSEDPSPDLPPNVL